ncbi:hypothetical protein EDB19DRAFT_1833510 [Suillus lakei]|nr:hypothetical protein EDB19DRAFT_1833510 [Suillus lakei]
MGHQRHRKDMNLAFGGAQLQTFLPVFRRSKAPKVFGEKMWMNRTHTASWTMVEKVAKLSSLSLKTGRLKCSNAIVGYTINEDEWTEFTNHINMVIENNPALGTYSQPLHQPYDSSMNAEMVSPSVN